MFLYSMTLSKATAINQSVAGSFSEPNVDEIVVAKGKVIELIRPETTTSGSGDDNEESSDNLPSGRLYTISSQEVFGIVRKLLVFRLLGM